MTAPELSQTTAEVADRLLATGTSTVSDALDRLGIIGQVADVTPVRPGMRLSGRAYTLLYEPVDADGGTVGDFIDDVGPDDVLVLDNGGRTDVTVWGDILTTVAAARHLRGTVIDGTCRDTDRIMELDFPVFSVGRWMRTGKDRVRLKATNVDVQLSGIPVAPGDVVVGDNDGIVVVPAHRALEVLDVAEEIARAETLILSLVGQGKRLDQARDEAGYHRLQTPQDNN